MEKLCIICGENDEVMFYPSRKNKCKKCISDEYKNKSDDEKKEYIEKQKKWRGSNLIRYRVDSAKHRAIRKGLVFEITDDVIQQKLLEQNGKCYVSKQPLIMDENNWRGLSLDRLDNNLGYTIDNTILVTKFVNSSKNTLSLDDYIKLLMEVCRNIE
jgi:hypothetical protein